MEIMLVEAFVITFEKAFNKNLKSSHGNFACTFKAAHIKSN